MAEKFNEWWKSPELSWIWPQQQPEQPVAQNGEIYTGAGEDGVVQPNQPAMAIGRAMLHEGETVKKNGQVIPNQDTLRKMEASGKYIGMQTGGNVNAANMRPEGYGKTEKPIPTASGALSTIYNAIPDTVKRDVKSEIAMSQTGQSVPEGYTTPIPAPTTETKQATGIGAVMTPEIAAKREAEKGTTPTDYYRDVMNMESPIYQAQYQKYAQDLSGAATAAQQAAQQEAAQRGLTQEAIGGMQTTMARDALQSASELGAERYLADIDKSFQAAGKYSDETWKTFDAMLDSGDTKNAEKTFNNMITGDNGKIDLSRVEDRINKNIRDGNTEEIVAMMDLIDSGLESGLYDEDTAKAFGAVVQEAMIGTLTENLGAHDIDVGAVFSDALANIEAGIDPEMNPEQTAAMENTIELLEAVSSKYSDQFQIFKHKAGITSLDDVTPENAEEFGNFAAALITQETAGELSAADREILKKYGVYNSLMDVALAVEQAAVETFEADINQDVSQGNINTIKSKYEDFIAQNPQLQGKYTLTDAINSLGSMKDENGQAVVPPDWMVKHLQEGEISADESNIVVDAIVGANASKNNPLTDTNIGKITYVENTAGEKIPVQLLGNTIVTKNGKKILKVRIRNLDTGVEEDWYPKYFDAQWINKEMRKAVDDDNYQWYTSHLPEALKKDIGLLAENYDRDFYDEYGNKVEAATEGAAKGFYPDITLWYDPEKTRMVAYNANRELLNEPED